MLKNQRIIALVFIVLTQVASAFVARTYSAHSRSFIHTFMSDADVDDVSSPSDTSSERVINVASEPIENSPSQEVITSILDELTYGRPAVFSALSKDTRSKINEALLKLESMNPTSQPTQSPLLNGVWKLRYAGGYSDEWTLPSPTRDIALFLYAGGYSPGLFALTLASKLPKSLVDTGDLLICKFSNNLFICASPRKNIVDSRHILAISRANPRVEAKIDAKLLGGASNEVLVKTNLDIISDIRMTETYESISVLGQKIDVPQALKYSRELYITYLDEDVLVVRDASGTPEILVRNTM